MKAQKLTPEQRKLLNKRLVRKMGGVKQIKALSKLGKQRSAR